MLLLSELIDVLGELYPWDLAVEGDNCGLQVGSPGARIKGVYCTLDASTEAIDNAVKVGCELLVTHHPIIFEPLSTLDTGSPPGHLIEQAVAAGVNVVACHTNADSALGGTADILADYYGLTETVPLVPATGVPYMKAVVFVPTDSLEVVSAAMAGEGAGVIGKYTHCGFRTPGIGTFFPEEGSQPHAGKKGVLNREDEVRLEMVVPSFLVPRVVAAMIREHPYEEVAYDLYRTENPVPWGLGRIGKLRNKTTAGALMEKGLELCGPGEPVLSGDRDKSVTTVAVVPGSANSLVGRAADAGADLLLAGEVNYHGTLEAVGRGMALICLGHAESERKLIPRMVDELRTASDSRGWGLVIEGN